MPHNRASPGMFRFRSHAAFLAWAVIAVLSAVTPAGPTAFPYAQTPSAALSRTQAGIDVYESMDSEPLRGKHVGLITNQTGVDAHGLHTRELFSYLRDVKLVALFSPEHGIGGEADAAVANT